MMKCFPSILAAAQVAISCVSAAQPQIVTAVAPDVSAGGNSFAPLVTADGQRVFFLSHARNLHTNGNGRSMKLFMRDLSAENTWFASPSTNGFASTIDNVFLNGASSSGQVVLFSSRASDLVSGDTNGALDFFTRDTITATTHIVAQAQNGDRARAAGPVTNQSASISADGRYVFFDSNGTNLCDWPPDENATMDVFRRDLQLNTNVLISRARPLDRSGNSRSLLASITSDGRRAAFISSAGDLVSGASNILGDVYVRDLQTNHTFWVGPLAGFFTGPHQCTAATLSADGRFVTLYASSTNELGLLFRHDLETQTTVSISSNVLTVAGPRISANGRYVVFETGTNVLRWDSASANSQVVSVTTNGVELAKGSARMLAMTPDANTLALISDSAELTVGGSSNRHVYVRDMSAGVTRLVSAATNGFGGGVDLFASASISDDGSGIAFDSTADDLVPSDANRASDVFVRDLTGEVTMLVSAAAPSHPRLTGLGDSFVGARAFSADGRYLAFTTMDNDHFSGDTNGRLDLVIQDLTTGTRVGAPISSNMNCLFPALTGDAESVLFVQANIQSYYGGAGTKRLVRFDRPTGTNRVLLDFQSTSSPTSAPAINMEGSLMAHYHSPVQFSLAVLDATGNTNVVLNGTPGLHLHGELQDAIFTPDSRFLLFYSTANLTTNAISGGQLYAWDFVDRATRLVSWHGGVGTGVRGSLAISQNSRYVVFCSRGLPTFNHMVYRYDFVTGTAQPVGLQAPTIGTAPVISADGRFVALESVTNNQIYVVDMVNGEWSLATGTLTGAASFQRASRPTISADGRFVTFLSRATNLVPGLSPGPTRLYVRDRLLGVTFLGAGGDGNISTPIPSPDGRTIAFHTLASDLVPGDYNDKRDIFVLNLGGDTDDDGLDDDWEVTYFDDLARGGSDDFDNDGVSDRDEFLAGTDPKDGESVFRVMTVQSLGSNSRQIVWTGNPDRSYRIEFKDDLSASAWDSLNAAINWSGSTASATDSNATNAQRFYRAVRLP